MKPTFPRSCVLTFIAWGLVALAVLPSDGRAVEFTAGAATFDADAVMVRVDAGVRRIRLRQWNAGSQTWELLQIAHLQGDPGYIKLRVPDGASLETIKVEVSSSDPFPHAFYAGRTSFGQKTEIDGSTAGGLRTPGLVSGVGGFTGAPDAVGVGAEVVESDIWKIAGDRLYFFNQLRGLQLFDLSTAGAPTNLASLRLPGVGEQMYVLDDRYTILLAAWRSWNQSEIVLTDYDAARGLRETKRFPLPGAIVESRLIGRQLYVVTRFSEYSFVEGPTPGGNGGPTGGHWILKSGLDLSVFDFTDPANPVEKPGLQLAEQGAQEFYNAQVAATATHLLVSTVENNGTYNRSELFVIDIADQSKDPVLTAQVPVQGWIAGKFQMRVQDDILTTVSQVSDWSNRRFETVVETFELDATLPESHRKLDEVAMGLGEQLFATRFHGDRLYVVTFAQIDPFWVVAIGDPRQLEILGELEVPGFSRYLEPWGDNVIAIGVEDRVVTASLFNATDPQHPTLLSRVRLGEGYSWSEANYDEKAVRFDPDRGLLLVPYQSWDNGVSAQNVQIIDVAADALTKRGVIEHNFVPRRAGLWEENIVSVSARELLVVGAADRDHPVELSRTTIAWSTDRVFTAGDFLVQIEEGGAWDGAPTNSLRVTTAANPDAVVAELPLGDGMIIGAARRDDRLHVLSSRIEYIPGPGDGTTVPRAERTLVSAVVDLTDPAVPRLLGAARLTGETSENWYYGASDMKALWLPGGELAWVTNNAGADWWRWGLPANDLVVGIVPRDFFFYQPLAEVHVVDVSDPTTPAFLSSTRVGNQNSWSYSPGFLIAESRIGFTYEENTWLELDRRFLQENTLRVVDLTNPAAPQVSDKISIAGSLASVVRHGSGAVLLTESRQSARHETPADRWWSDEYLQASVFDGVSTFLLSEMKIDDGAYAVSAYDGGTTYRQLATGAEDLRLLGHVWNSQTGAFDAAPPVKQEQWQSQLVIRDDLLLGWQYPTALTVIDIKEPLAPGSPQRFAFGANLWAQLAGALVDRDTGAWIPTGSFGVEYVDFDGAFAGASDSAVRPLPAVAAAEGPEWLEVSVAALQIVGADAVDYLGDLSGVEWRYVRLPAPATQRVDAGGSVTVSVELTGTPALTCQWQRNGVDIPGATGPSYMIPSAQRFHAGEYTVVVTNAGGSLTSAAASLAVEPPPRSDARLLNLSTRGLARSGDGALLPGFVVSGTGTKQLLIRAVGPTLTDLGVPLVVIPDPMMALKRRDFSSDPPAYVDVTSNDDWQTNTNAADIAAIAAEVGAFALTQAPEAALLVNLPAGQYSVVAADKHAASGVAIVELYDADESNPTAHLINLSNRGFVGVGSEVMIPGFVVSNEGSRTFLIRVVGPTLAEFGVADFLADPKLTLYRSGAIEPLLTNNDWSENPDADHTAEVGAQVFAFALDAGSKDAAVVVTLAPGTYTVIGASADDVGTGVALVEVYLVP